MLPVINHLPLRLPKNGQPPAESFLDETSGCANLAAWHRPISPPCGGLAAIGYVLIGALSTLGLLLLIHQSINSSIQPSNHPTIHQSPHPPSYDRTE